jgi:hypothetical protein
MVNSPDKGAEASLWSTFAAFAAEFRLLVISLVTVGWLIVSVLVPVVAPTWARGSLRRLTASWDLRTTPNMVFIS